MEIGVVIPAYNVADRLRDVLLQIPDWIPRNRICVVDDGSNDGTAEVARAGGVRCVSFSKNSGKGIALKAGIQQMLGEGVDALFLIDGDGQHDPRMITEFLRILNQTGCDAVCGVRRFSIGQMPVDRILSNTLSSVLVSLVTGRRVRDSQCGFRLFRSAVLRHFTIHARRFEVETEMLLKTIAGGFVIAECPIPTLYPGGGSHIRRIPDTFRFLRLIVCYLFKNGWR